MGKSGDSACQAEDPEAGGGPECPWNSKEASVTGDGVTDLAGHWVSQLL